MKQALISNSPKLSGGYRFLPKLIVSLTMTFCMIFIGITTANAQNLAEGKTASQSTTAYNSPASNAVDGKSGSRYSSNQSLNDITHTSSQDNPWWQVDLGSVQNITEIKIFNRADCCWNRLQNFYVMVSETPITSNSTTAKQFVRGPLSFTSAAEKFKSLKGSAKGRYVRIFIAGQRKILSLGEVQVFGERVNIAQGKTASQSTTTYNSPASKAVDGKVGSRYSSNQSLNDITHTSTQDNPWWQVDLGSVQNISEIKIFNRADCCWDRLKNFYVMVSETPITSNSTTAKQFVRGPLSFTSAAEKFKSLTGSAKGRYVRIFIAGQRKILSLGEVQVFETPEVSINSAQLNDFYKSHGGESTFNTLYVDALSTMINTEDAVKRGDYEQAKRLLGAIWAKYPIGDAVWKQGGQKVNNTNIGNPVAYNSLRMLTDVVNYELNKTAGQTPSKIATLRVVLVGKSDGVKPRTITELKNGTGAPSRKTLNGAVKADNYRILRQSTALFQRYVLAMTKGQLKVEIEFLELPEVSMTTRVNSTTASPIYPTSYDAIWNASKVKAVYNETDWWWVIYPSQVPEDNPSSPIGFDNYAYTTGGMTGDKKGGPVFVIDDLWVIRKPAHMGKGPYTDIERRAYLPQWFQHEFYHHVFGIYPALRLEPTSHAWFDRNFWPREFVGTFEADYYQEALYKKLQKATPPLHEKLASHLSPDLLAKLKPADVLGSYGLENPTNNWHTGEVLLEGGKYYWKNKANVKWEVTPMLSEGILKNESTTRYPGQNFHIKLKTDANGNYTSAIEGLQFGSGFYKRK